MASAGLVGVFLLLGGVSGFLSGLLGIGGGGGPPSCPPLSPSPLLPGPHLPLSCHRDLHGPSRFRRPYRDCGPSPFGPRAPPAAFFLVGFGPCRWSCRSRPFLASVGPQHPLDFSRRNLAGVHTSPLSACGGKAGGAKAKEKSLGRISCTLCHWRVERDSGGRGRLSALSGIDPALWIPLFRGGGIEPCRHVSDGGYGGDHQGPGFGGDPLRNPTHCGRSLGRVFPGVPVHPKDGGEAYPDLSGGLASSDSPQVDLWAGPGEGGRVGEECLR